MAIRLSLITCANLRHQPVKPAPKKQCPYCLRKFPGNLLNEHKKTCTCRIVTCKFCGKGRMARQITTHEKFCDKRPKDGATSGKAGGKNKSDKTHAKGQHKHPKTIKTHELCNATASPTPGPGSRTSQKTFHLQPQRQRGRLTPAQLRLARTHERIEIEIEIDFPVRGVGQAGLAPPNLRYMVQRWKHVVNN